VEDESIIILLAQVRRGYANLCRILTAGRLRSEKGESVVTWDEIYRHANRLLALWGGDQSLIVGEVEPNEVAGNLRDAFGDRLYGMITRHRREDEVVQEARLRERAKRYGFQLAAANEVLYHTPARRQLQDVLTAIRYGIPVASCGNDSRPTQSTLSTRPIFLPDFLPTIRRPSFARRRLPTAAVFLWLKSVIVIPLSTCPTAQHPRIGCAVSLSRAPVSATARDTGGRRGSSGERT
jgi:hypothetical protein